LFVCIYIIYLSSYLHCNYLFISLFHFLFIKANIKKHDTKDKEMICIIIVGDMVISLIVYIYIIYYTSYLVCMLYKANRRDLRDR